MNKLGRIIDNIPYEELLLLKRDLEIGNIERLINKRIEHFKTEKKIICATCNAEIADSGDNQFTLVFGPRDFKKRATFCAMDCMLYFTDKLKEISIKKINGELDNGTWRNDSNF